MSTGARAVRSGARRGRRVTTQKRAAGGVAAAVGEGAGEHPSSAGMAHRAETSRSGPASRWRTVAILVHAQLLQRRIPLVGSSVEIATSIRANNGPRQSALWGGVVVLVSSGEYWLNPPPAGRKRGPLPGARRQGEPGCSPERASRGRLSPRRHRISKRAV